MARRIAGAWVVVLLSAVPVQPATRAEVRGAAPAVPVAGAMMGGADNAGNATDAAGS